MPLRVHSGSAVNTGIDRRKEKHDEQDSNAIAFARNQVTSIQAILYWVILIILQIVCSMIIRQYDPSHSRPIPHKTFPRVCVYQDVSSVTLTNVSMS